MIINIRLILITFFFISLLTSCKKTEKTYYENGRLKTIAKVTSEGNWDGPVKRYYDDGNIEYIASYANGKLNGLVKWYSKSGDLYKTETYSKGKLEGLVILYDSLGYKHLEQDYVNGKEIGYRFYDTLGNVDAKFVYLDTLNLPAISGVKIRFDRDTNNFHLHDTISVDIRIPNISKNQISIACTKARWYIDYRLDSFLIDIMPVRTGDFDLYIYLKVNDKKEVRLGKKTYYINK
jgi:hypothetical protein